MNEQTRTKKTVVKVPKGAVASAPIQVKIIVFGETPNARKVYIVPL